jgi:hypothetical protein
MSTSYEGKCEHCGKVNLRVTIGIHIYDTPGTLATEEWCLECVQGKENGSGNAKNSQNDSTKWPAT